MTLGRDGVVPHAPERFALVQRLRPFGGVGALHGYGPVHHVVCLQRFKRAALWWTGGPVIELGLRVPIDHMLHFKVLFATPECDAMQRHLVPVTISTWVVRHNTRKDRK